MEINKASSTYRRYVAAESSYGRFFDTWTLAQDNVGFCSMMRTIYFWAPAIAVFRVLSMVATVAIVFFAFYVRSTEIIAGIAVLSLLALIVWLANLVVVANEGFFEGRETPLLFQWAKASHDKVCPLVTFTEEE